MSNDNISTGLCDRLYSSYFDVLVNPRRSLILSSGTNTRLYINLFLTIFISN